MDKYSITAGQILVTYLWKRIKEEFGWKESDYSGLVPIFPVQQQPEANSMTRPYMVFTSALDPASPLWLLESETVGITTYSTKINDVNRVSALVVDEFKRWDESANSVNNWLDTLPSPDYDHFKRFEFKTIRFMGGSGAQPALQEAGRVDGDVIIKATYVQYD